MKEKNFYRINADIFAEIRKCETEERTFQTKDGKDITSRTLVIKILDSDDNSAVLEDKNLEHETLYKRGITGTFKVILEVDDTDWKARKVKIHVMDFKPDKKDKK